jgi:hypothetical protein
MTFNLNSLRPIICEWSALQWSARSIQVIGEASVEKRVTAKNESLIKAEILVSALLQIRSTNGAERTWW